MQFLRTLFWVILAVIAVVFAANNWTPVNILLWSDVAVETKLPVLMFGAFLIGLLPLLLWHRATRWTMRRKLTKVETALAQEQASRNMTTTVASGADLTPAPASTPMAVPPGVA
jgi:uncharacterized integral membrane protein